MPWPRSTRVVSDVSVANLRYPVRAIAGPARQVPIRAAYLFRGWAAADPPVSRRTGPPGRLSLAALGRPEVFDQLSRRWSPAAEEQQRALTVLRRAGQVVADVLLAPYVVDRTALSVDGDQLGLALDPVGQPAGSWVGDTTVAVGGGPARLAVTTAAVLEPVVEAARRRVRVRARVFDRLLADQLWSHLCRLRRVAAHPPPDHRLRALAEHAVPGSRIYYACAFPSQAASRPPRASARDGAIGIRSRPTRSGNVALPGRRPSGGPLRHQP